MAGDTSGVLQLATNGSTTAVTVDTSQNVGIGNTSPAAKLDVSGTIAVSPGAALGRIRRTTVSGSNGLSLQGNTADSINDTNPGASIIVGGGPLDDTFGGQVNITAYGGNFSNANLITFSNRSSTNTVTEHMRLTGGSLCIGTTTPNSQFNSSAARLTIGQWGVGPTVDFGNWYLQNSSGVGVQLITGNTSFSTLSDERTKTDLKPIENAIDKVATLRAVTGRYIKDEDVVSRAFLIAQDVQKVLPEAVAAGEDEDQTLQLKYTEVIPLLVAAIKEQQTIINDLKARITALEGAA
jgi:hypothetical protein